MLTSGPAEDTDALGGPSGRGERVRGPIVTMQHDAGRSQDPRG